MSGKSGAVHGRAIMPTSITKTFQPPPPGTQFRGQLGMRFDSKDWIECDPESVVKAIYASAWYPVLRSAGTFMLKLPVHSKHIGSLCFLFSI